MQLWFCGSLHNFDHVKILNFCSRMNKNNEDKQTINIVYKCLERFQYPCSILSPKTEINEKSFEINQITYSRILKRVL